jgi:hypothetical protein
MTKSGGISRPMVEFKDLVIKEKKSAFPLSTALPGAGGVMGLNEVMGPGAVIGQGNMFSSTNMDASKIQKTRQQQESKLNSEIQKILVGLRPSIVEMMLVQEENLSIHDQVKLQAQYKREDSESGIVGIGGVEKNTRVIFVHIADADDPVLGDNDADALTDIDTLSSDKSSRILVGSPAFRVANKINAKVKLLNIPMYEKISEALKNDYTMDKLVEEVGPEYGGALQKVNTYGWDQTVWDRGFTLLHWAARQGHVDQCKEGISFTHGSIQIKHRV